MYLHIPSQGTLTETKRHCIYAHSKKAPYLYPRKFQLGLKALVGGLQPLYSCVRHFERRCARAKLTSRLDEMKIKPSEDAEPSRRQAVSTCHNCTCDTLVHTPRYVL